jgi:squalene-hopene/tetraprenyl-beta-curcumene cyclase
MVLLPKWFPVNLYAVSAWSRAIIVPLSIVSALAPVRRVDSRRGIRELFLKSPDRWPPPRCPGLPAGAGLLSWDRFFRAVDKGLKWCRRLGLLPLRRRALRAAEKWMLERFEGSDGLGAIFPPIVWSLVALRALGYDDDRPEVVYCHEQLEALVVETGQGEGVKIQPCKSPVWDTALTLRALAAGGVSRESPAVTRAVEWLLDHEITRHGDWAETVVAQPGGWCFEHRNDFYPDCDDTAMVLMALADQFDPAPQAADRLPPELRLVSEAAAEGMEEALRRVDLVDRTAASMEAATDWLLAMQNDDGGWGAFDRNNNRRFLCHVPFADHNAMIDPSTPDLTARVLECLGRLGRRPGDPAVDRGVEYLRGAQEPDGSWFGRWGVNYVYGTWQALVGLTAMGLPAGDPAVAAGANWLVASQQPCGGWGESPKTYDDPALRGQGPPTASQTAWAVMGLLAAGWHDHPATLGGVRCLVESQQTEGTWDEPEFTGTGFPRVFYLRYHYYPIYFPLMALARWAAGTSMSLAKTAEPKSRAEKEPNESDRRRSSASGTTAVGTREVV